MPNDPFDSFADNPTAPAQNCFAILPDDASELPSVTKAIYVGAEGDVTLRPVGNSSPVTFRNVPAGFILDVRAAAVHATGTTAADIVGMA